MTVFIPQRVWELPETSLDVQQSQIIVNAQWIIYLSLLVFKEKIKSEHAS